MIRIVGQGVQEWTDRFDQTVGATVKADSPDRVIVHSDDPLACLIVTDAALAAGFEVETDTVG